MICIPPLCPVSDIAVNRIHSFRPFLSLASDYLQIYGLLHSFASLIYFGLFKFHTVCIIIIGNRHTGQGLDSPVSV
jgi:hypothetical protein